MAIQMVSFRIGAVGNDDVRRDLLCSALEELSTMHWKDTTSFYVMDAELSTREIAEEAKTIINQNYDVVLVRSLERKEAYVVGAVEDNDLFRLMPYCSRL